MTSSGMTVDVAFREYLLSGSEVESEKHTNTHMPF